MEILRSDCEVREVFSVVVESADEPELRTSLKKHFTTDLHHKNLSCPIAKGIALSTLKKTRFKQN